MTEASAAGGRPAHGRLAALVALLAVAVVAVGGYLAFRMAERNAAVDPAEVAIEKWQQAAKASPDDAATLTSLGYAYQEAGRYEEALREYDRALTLDPKNLAALYNRTVVLRELGRDADADAGLTALLAIAPDHVLAAKALGERYVAQGRYAEALRVLEPAIRANPRYADMQYLAGYACERLGRAEDAAAHYREALRYAPEMPEPSAGLERLGEEVDPE